MSPTVNLHYRELQQVQKPVKKMEICERNDPNYYIGQMKAKQKQWKYSNKFAHICWIVFVLMQLCVKQYIKRK